MALMQLEFPVDVKLRRLPDGTWAATSRDLPGASVVHAEEQEAQRRMLAALEDMYMARVVNHKKWPPH